MYYPDDGYFLLKFRTHKDMETIMKKGSYTIRNMPMLLRELKHDFNLKEYIVRTIPIWIKNPQLPLYHWGSKSLRKIKSALGTPLLTECTANKLRVLDARILVEMDVT